MKAIFSFTHLPFKHLFGHLTIGLLLIGSFAQAQEAFYIYRNEGDIHGFFYDEVVEMRYSKIGVDSVESDVFVTCEVELADTTYRIPLAAIDSIGFQQPEIKLNPKVKLIQNAGLSPYLKDVNEFGNPEELVAFFEDLPTSLVPQVGDVLIGVGTDDCGEIYDKLGGSFSLVVQRVSSSDNQIFVYGRQVEEVGEVFEQFISVEQIGLDEEGKIRRRIAGCDENGLPRRITQVEGDHSTYLIDFNGNINHEWSVPKDSSKVVLNADINFQVFMRAQYNITLLRGVYVKLTYEFRTRIKPSLNLTLNGELRANSDNPYFLYLEEVLFPVSCPVFAIKPWPSYFMHLGGSIDAKLNFPQIYLGLGIEYTINSNSLFPIGVNLYWAPDDGAKPDDEMLSAEFSISGSIHQGIEFEGMINTASWFKKVLQVAAGVHLYVGPKVTASASFKHDFFQENNHNSLYTLLSSAKIDLSLISILMELTAKTKLGWHDPQEKTFFSGTKDFLEHQLRIVPVFDKTEVEFTEKDAIVKLKPKSGTNLKFKTYYLGIFDAAQGLYVTDSITPKEIMQGDKWIEKESDEEIDHITTIPLEKLEVGKKYYAVPVIDDDSLNFIAHGAEVEFSVPMFMKMDKDSLHFDVSGNPVQTFDFKTNGRPHMQDYIEFQMFKEVRLDTINIKDGEYRYTLKGTPNRFLFHSLDVPKLHPFCPSIRLSEEVGKYDYPIVISQDDNDLSNVQVILEANFGNAHAIYNGQVKATRGNGQVSISGSVTDNFGTHTIKMTLTESVADSALYMKRGADGKLYQYKEQGMASGTITSRYDEYGQTRTVTISFDNLEVGSQKGEPTGIYQGQSGTLTSGKHTIEYSDGHSEEETLDVNKLGEIYWGVGGTVIPKVPGEE